MTARYKSHSIYQIYTVIVILEMVLGGTGRLIMIGPLSLRILLMAIGSVLMLGCWIREGHAVGGTRSNILLFLLVLYFFANLVMSLLFNNRGQAVDVFTGYISILMCLYFAWFFSQDSRDFTYYLNVFRIGLFIAALISLALWVYSYRRGLAAYPVLRPLLDKYVYGNLSYLGTSGIPRIFMKVSVYMPIGILLSFNDILNGRKRLRAIVEMGVLFLSLLTSFTVAFYAVAALAILLLLIFKKNLSIGKVLLLIIILLLVFAVLRFSGAMNVLLGRLSSDGMMDYKSSQAMQLLKYWSENPVFGKGFGYSVNLYYNADVSYGAYQFEVMWFQLLLNTGLVGFFLFAAHITGSIRKLHRLYRRTENEAYLILWISILYLCLVSFSNPFMNNSIGLLFYAMASGIADANDPGKEEAALEEVYG